MSESNGLPKGWVEVPLGECGTWHGGGTPSKANDSFWRHGTVPWISPKDMKAPRLTDSEDHISQSAIEETNVKPFPSGTVLIVIRSGILGRTLPVAVADVSATMNQDLKGIHPASWLDSLYLAHLLRSREISILRSCSKDGTTVASIDTSALHAVLIQIPPLPEQHRIVETIEELFSDLDAGVSALQRAKANLKRYRASVLKSAVEGRLTEDWRKEHPQAEDGAMLLDRILRERREKWERDQLLKFKQKGKEPPKNWESKYEEPSAPDTSELPELPVEWVWASLDMLLRESLRNGHSARTSEDGRGVRTISITAVTYDAFTEDNIKYTIADPTFVEDLWLEPGDTLIQRSNTPELVGTARLFTGESRFAIFPDLLIRIRTTPAISERFIALLLQASATRYYFRTHAKGMSGSMPKIDQGTVLECPVPLPPLAEQEQIVALVDERLSQIDAAEKTIDAELTRSKRLRQSILKRAFEGKLVPQDPKDEPASVLLDRIKAGREAEQPKKKSKKVKAK